VAADDATVRVLETATGKEISKVKELFADTPWRKEREIGKAFWVLEQLRAQEPEVLARYFRAKRQLAKPGALARMRPTRPSRC
jgi:hypothetical protein